MAIDNITFNSRSITNFRDRLVGGGARPNFFEVNITLPSSVDKLADVDTDVRSRRRDLGRQWLVFFLGERFLGFLESFHQTRLAELVSTKNNSDHTVLRRSQS